MDKVHHKLPRENSWSVEHLSWCLKYEPGWMNTVRVTCNITASLSERTICSPSVATRGDLRPFKCRKSQRDEHGGQVFIVQVEGSLFSQQHYSSLRPANEVTYNRYIMLLYKKECFGLPALTFLPSDPLFAFFTNE